MTENTKAAELNAMNDALCDFARRWAMDGDYLRCTSCNRPIIASHDKPFVHYPECKAGAASEPRPWQALIQLLRPLAAQPAVPEGVDWHTTPAPRDGRRFFAEVEGIDHAVFMQFDCREFLAIDEPIGSVTGRRILRWCNAPTLSTPQPESAQGERGAVATDGMKCGDCGTTGAVLFQCVACSHGNYPPDTTPTGDQNARAVGGWKSIETAPKSHPVPVNDTNADVACPVAIAFWMEAPGFTGWAYDDSQLTEIYPEGPRPTHWLDVTTPPAPVAQVGDGVGHVVAFNCATASPGHPGTRCARWCGDASRCVSTAAPTAEGTREGGEGEG